MSKQSGQGKKRKAPSPGGKLRTEPLVDDASNNAPSNVVRTDGSGNYNFLRCMSPRGVMGVDVSTQTVVTTIAPALVDLRADALRANQYKVRVATLIFTPSAGSQVSGQVIVKSSQNAMFSTANSSDPDVRVIPLSKTSPTRFNVNVSGGWKSTDPETLQVSGNNLTVKSTIDDIVFSTIALSVVGGPQNQRVGTLSLEYDPAFRGRP